MMIPVILETAQVRITDLYSTWIYILSEYCILCGQRLETIAGSLIRRLRARAQIFMTAHNVTRGPNCQNVSRILIG